MPTRRTLGRWWGSRQLSREPNPWGTQSERNSRDSGGRSTSTRRPPYVEQRGGAEVSSINRNSVEDRTDQRRPGSPGPIRMVVGRPVLHPRTVGSADWDI